MPLWKSAACRAAEADRGAMAGLFGRDLHDDAVAERLKRLQIELGGAGEVAHRHAEMIDLAAYSARSTSLRLSEAMALAGFSPLGQALVQLRMVWQR